MESVPDTIQMEFTEEIKEYVSGFLGSSATCLGECQGFPPRDGGSGWDISKEKCLEIDNIYYESIEFYISLIKNRRNIFLVETKRISLKTSFTFNKFRITYDANLKYPKKGKLTFVGSNFATQYVWDEFWKFNKRFKPDRFFRYAHGNFQVDYLLAKINGYEASIPLLLLSLKALFSFIPSHAT